MSNWETMDNMNIMCHWAINQINPWVDDVHMIKVIYWARQRWMWGEGLFRIINYSPYSLGMTRKSAGKRGKYFLVAPWCCRNSLVDKFSELIQTWFDKILLLSSSAVTKCVYWLHGASRHRIDLCYMMQTARYYQAGEEKIKRFMW